MKTLVMHNKFLKSVVTSLESRYYNFSELENYKRAKKCLASFPGAQSIRTQSPGNKAKNGPSDD